MQTTKTSDKSRLRREWSKEAIDLAMNGEWQRATEVNQALLTLYPEDADAQNRLGHAFIELAEYARAREVLAEVVAKAPYNNIAQKNLARLEQLENAPADTKQTRKSGGLSKFFIAESGKSGTTVLQRPAGSKIPASVAPGDPVTLVAQNQAIFAYVREGEFLGKVEARLASRLARLMAGGNRYEAAVVGINDWGVSIIIREAYRHPSVHNISSFPTNNRAKRRPLPGQNVLNYLESDDLEEDEEGAVEFVKINGFDGEWDE